MRRSTLLCIVVTMSAFPPARGSQAQPPRPNIVVICADDLGYGDVRCYNRERGRIPTPHIDALAARGMRFTDGHSSSGVCTPSRYTLLTGRYHWRTRLRRGVLDGFSGPLIDADRLTIAGLARQHGYATACIGKWHLGMTMPRPLTRGSITDGPTSRGFDSFFGISASLDMPPYAFIENDRFTEPPSVRKNLLAIRGRDGEQSRSGPAAPGFESTLVLPRLVDAAVDWIREHHDRPFLLYLAFTSPHTPLAPTAAWKGRSGLGDYADFVMQTDAAVGDVMAALDQVGATRSTLVILSSDNGAASYVGTKVSDDPRDSHDRSDAIKDLEAAGHHPSGPLRGSKASAHEGGHRVPFIVHWPEVVEPGTVSGQLVHQADLMRTFADIMGVTLPDDAGEDSVSLLPLLQGGTAPVREHAVSATGVFALRHGPWKMIVGPDRRDTDAGPGSTRLYNLDDDLGETNDLAACMPQKIAEMTLLLERLVTDGRSTPGAKQRNDAEVVHAP